MHLCCLFLFYTPHHTSPHLTTDTCRFYHQLVCQLVLLRHYHYIIRNYFFPYDIINKYFRSNNFFSISIFVYHTAYHHYCITLVPNHMHYSVIQLRVFQRVTFSPFYMQVCRLSQMVIKFVLCICSKHSYSYMEF